LLKIKNKLKTTPASAKEQNLKFWVIRKVHFASRLFTYNC